MTLPRFRRSPAGEQRSPGTELVLVPRLNQASPGTTVGPAPAADQTHRPPQWAQRVDTTVGLPNPAKARAMARYYTRVLPKGIVFLLPRILAALARELAQATRGLGKCTGAWKRWVSAHGWHEAAAESKGTSHAPHVFTRRENARQWRRRSTFVCVFGGLGLAWWLAAVHVYWLLAGGVAVGELLAIVGRWDREPREAPPAKRMILNEEGVPLSQVSAEILLALSLRGIEATPEPMTWDTDRQERRLTLATYEPLTSDDLRAIERRIGAGEGSIKKIGGDSATEVTLVISYGNPLVGLPPAPDHLPLSQTITEPRTLGKAVGPMPYAITAAGTHMCVISTTGGGKTEGTLRAMINETTACFDAVNWWIDLQGGPEGPLWGDVLQRQAYTPEQADAVLDAAITECYRRMAVLAASARDAHQGTIDPDKITSVWHADLGPALIIYFDEFAIAAEYDGKGGKLNLLGKVETLMRLGRKVWISIIRGTQKTGNSDSGSSVISTQTTVWIVGPCDMDDTVNVFGKAKRDAGYSPQNLHAATPYEINDAGMAYVLAAGFGPDTVRSWAPLDEGEIIRRSRRRVAAGLPRLDVPGAEPAIDGELVPDCLAAVEAALAAYGNPERLASKLVLEHANANGGSWTAITLPKALEPYEVKPRTGRCAVAGGTPRCYCREDVQAALSRLGN